MNTDCSRDLADACRRALECGSASLTALASGVMNEVFEVRVAGADRRYVLRLARQTKRASDFEKEAWILNRALSIGLPVPKPIYVDNHAGLFPRPAALFEMLPGVSPEGLALTQPQLHAIFGQLGRILRALHSLEISGFGPIVQGRSGFSGRHSCLADYLAHELGTGEWRRPILDSNLAEADLFERISRRLRDRAQLFAEVKPAIVHNDVYIANLLCDRESRELTGLLDFENAISGDPLMDFRYIHRPWEANESGSFAACRRGYGAGESMSEVEGERLHLYQLLSSLYALGFSVLEGKESQAKDYGLRVSCLRGALGLE